MQNALFVRNNQHAAPAVQIPGNIANTPGQQKAVYQIPQPHQDYTNNIPRYAPMVYRGQTYPAAIPNTVQQSHSIPKSGSVGTVNITVNGVNPPGQQTCPACTPSAPVPQYYPVPYYLPQYIPQPVPSNKKETISEQPLAAIKPEIPKKEKPAAAAPISKAHATDTVDLNDVYIMELEDNLRNKRKEVRHHAVAELLNRFKEDPSRKNDERLTNLLNLALQDNSKPIVYAAMQAVKQDYANGNLTTANLLAQIASKEDSFGNFETARQILSKKRRLPAVTVPSVPIKE